MASDQTSSHLVFRLFLLNALNQSVATAQRFVHVVPSALSNNIICVAVLSSFNHLLSAALANCCHDLIAFVVSRYALITKLVDSFLEIHTILLLGSADSRALIPAYAPDHAKLPI